MKFSTSSLAVTLGALVATTAAERCFTKSGFGDNTLANFTLNAVNTTLPNANSTGVPLARGLTLGPAGGKQAWWIITLASFPYASGEELTLTDGAIDLALPVIFTSRPVASGDALGMANADQLNGTAAGDDYCIVHSLVPNRLPKLAVNGHTDLFNICQYSAGTPFAQSVVVYNGSIVPGDSNPTGACYPVELLVQKA